MENKTTLHRTSSTKYNVQNILFRVGCERGIVIIKKSGESLMNTQT